MNMQVLIVDHEQVVELLPMDECIEVVAGAMKAYSAGDTVVPLRSIIWLPDKSGGLGLMPGCLGTPATIGLKIVTVFPKNEGTPYESHQGAVMLFDVENGRLLTIIDACEITTIRTAAASAVATRVLAIESAQSLAILGAGTQGRSHLKAMASVRPLRRCFIWSRDHAKARAFADRESKAYDFEIVPTEDVELAVRESEIICTVTSAQEPIVSGQWLKPGAHINAIGACIPVARELDSDAVKRSRFYVDSRESATNESGDYLIALNEGAIGEDHIVGEVGDVLLGNVAGRDSDQQITIFKSLGLAFEDLASANHIYKRALKRRDATMVTVGGLRHEAG